MLTALDFEYGGITCSYFDLQVASFSRSSTEEEFFGTPLTIVEQASRNRTKPTFLGAHIEGKIEFDITLVSEKEMDAHDLQTFNRWLFAPMYKKLVIYDERYSDVYFMAMFTTPKKVTFGKYPIAFSVKIVCDAAYGYKEVQEDINKIIYVEQDVVDYTYPVVEFVMPTIENLVITNETLGESMIFAPVAGVTGTKIVDCDRKDCPVEIFKGFNRKWLRLVPGDNSLISNSNDVTMTLTYKKTI